MNKVSWNDFIITVKIRFNFLDRLTLPTPFNFPSIGIVDINPKNLYTQV